MKRIQLSRRKGWKLPPDTIVVSRPSRWGNPFIAGKHGTRQRCAELFKYLCGGFLCISVDKPCVDRQRRFLQHAAKHVHTLRGKNLACWCPLTVPDDHCHAGVLLQVANRNAN